MENIKKMYNQYDVMEIYKMNFKIHSMGLFPLNEEALDFLEALPSLFNNPTRCKYYTETARHGHIYLPWKNIPGSNVSQRTYYRDCFRGVPSRIETPYIQLEIELPKSFFDHSNNCGCCAFMVPDNRGFCWNPKRVRECGYQEGEEVFSEITADREDQDIRCWCPYYRDQF